VDCHAGRGVYDLRGEQARKTREAESGILRLVSPSAAPDAVRDYLDLVGSFNRNADLHTYPGSAALARAVLREQDRAILLELHPQEHSALKRYIGKDRRIGVHARDCYEGLPALVPPAIKRGLVLIDPSYEVKSELRPCWMRRSGAGPMRFTCSGIRCCLRRGMTFC
jgi:23S rRNA (adenine2030-N6)-methyltransferase